MRDPRKVGTGFRRRSRTNKKLGRDDDSTKNHPALDPTELSGSISNPAHARIAPRGPEPAGQGSTQGSPAPSLHVQAAPPTPGQVRAGEPTEPAYIQWMWISVQPGDRHDLAALELGDNHKPSQRETEIIRDLLPHQGETDIGVVIAVRPPMRPARNGSRGKTRSIAPWPTFAPATLTCSWSAARRVARAGAG